MARTVIITDDLTGEQGAKTRVIVIDRTEYEVDLTDASMAELKETLRPYLKHARITKGAPKGRRTAKRSAAPSQAQAVREWAAQNGVDVPKRGRVPASVIAAFEAAK